MMSTSMNWKHKVVQVACMMFLACSAAHARESGIGSPGRPGISSKITAQHHLASNNKSLANGLHLDGRFDATVSHGLALASVGGIDNDAATGSSGPLRLELWAVADRPDRGAAFSGYQLAVGPQYDGLVAGTTLDQPAFGSTISTPPDGSYWLVLSLTQYDPANCPSDNAWCVNEDSMVSGEPVQFTTFVMLDQAAAQLENPGPASFQSGIGLISGWSCEGPVSLVIDGVESKVAYGSPRADAAPTCGVPNAGFGVLVNYNDMGAGMHTAQLWVNGVAKGDPRQFTVTVPINAFARGLSRTVTVPDFPTTGRNTTLVWQEEQQNFAIQSVSQ
jgi:hypothetical protein